ALSTVSLAEEISEWRATRDYRPNCPLGRRGSGGWGRLFLRGSQAGAQRRLPGSWWPFGGMGSMGGYGDGLRPRSARKSTNELRQRSQILMPRAPYFFQLVSLGLVHRPIMPCQQLYSGVRWRWPSRVRRLLSPCL